MSAEVLREAAALMRERAEGATPGPWIADGYDVLHGESAIQVADCFDDEAPNAEHIASWHPAVALAVADWLDGEAHWWEYGSSSPGSHGAALVVARAYLGSAS